MRRLCSYLGLFSVFVFLAVVFLPWQRFVEDWELRSLQSKAGELGHLCLAYSNSHNGQYPRDLHELVESGLVSNWQFNNLMSIQDWIGPWRTRAWVYAPDSDGILFCASEPCFEHGSGISRIRVWVACKNGKPVLLGPGNLPDNVHDIPAIEITAKGGQLALQCGIYAEDHGGHYPENFELLVEAGLISKDKLRRLVSIQDPTGRWTTRKWIYTPQDPTILLCTSQPVDYTHGYTGHLKTENAWIMYQHDRGTFPATEDQLPDYIKEGRTK